MKGCTISRLLLCCGTVLFAAAALVSPRAAAQERPLVFGSADDPREVVQAVWWRRESTLDVMGGLSLIGPQWRAAAGLGFNVVTRELTARFDGTLRAGIYGGYGPDADELYDALRLVSFVRYMPRRSPLYLRAGPLQQVRLGTGHLVDFYNSIVAYDERTVGVEGEWQTPYGGIAGFTDDVLLTGVTGARTALRPLARMDNRFLRPLTFGVSYITDLGRHVSGAPSPAAYSVDLRTDVLSSGDITVSPFVSYADYLNYGSGLSLGVDVASLNFIDLARFLVRFALYYNGRQFIPGYFGTFYGVSNPLDRICTSDRYFARAETCEAVEGVLLEQALGGNDILTELRLLIFERFELWYYFRRHYGTQNLSEYHFRLFFYLPSRVRFDVGIDRGGLGGVFSLLSELGDQTALVFNTNYRVGGDFWLFIRARYSFEKIAETPGGTDLFLIQRRFEPLAGLRFTF